MSRNTAAAIAYNEPVEPIAHTLMLRVLDAPAANDPVVATDMPRVRLFDRVQLATDRLARFELQVAPVASTGDKLVG